MFGGLLTGLLGLGAGLGGAMLWRRDVARKRLVSLIGSLGDSGRVGRRIPPEVAGEIAAHFGTLLDENSSAITIEYDDDSPGFLAVFSRGELVARVNVTAARKLGVLSVEWGDK